MCYNDGVLYLCIWYHAEYLPQLVEEIVSIFLPAFKNDCQYIIKVNHYFNIYFI